jgi:DNA-binding Lrp family transcriptional regulator
LEKKDPNFPKLTENDRFVLKQILDSKKITDSDIAKTMNLSPQAIFKIRNKLEDVGIIKCYMPIIDFKKIGITVMLVLIIRFTSKTWNNYTDDQISERIARTPYVIDAYRVSEEKASHILILGFRDTKQKEQYISQIQTKFAEDVEVNSAYTFSVDKIISHSPLGLLHEILDKKNFTPDDLFLENK